MRKLQQPLKSACLGIKSRLNKNDSDAAHTGVITPLLSVVSPRTTTRVKKKKEGRFNTVRFCLNFALEDRSRAIVLDFTSAMSRR